LRRIIGPSAVRDRSVVRTQPCGRPSHSLASPQLRGAVVRSGSSAAPSRPPGNSRSYSGSAGGIEPAGDRASAASRTKREAFIRGNVDQRVPEARRRSAGDAASRSRSAKAPSSTRAPGYAASFLLATATSEGSGSNPRQAAPASANGRSCDPVPQPQSITERTPPSTRRFSSRERCAGDTGKGVVRHAYVGIERHYPILGTL
jgi:hypothetical protein